MIQASCQDLVLPSDQSRSGGSTALATAPSPAPVAGDVARSRRGRSLRRPATAGPHPASADMTGEAARRAGRAPDGPTEPGTPPTVGRPWRRGVLVEHLDPAPAELDAEPMVQLAPGCLGDRGDEMGWAPRTARLRIASTTSSTVVSVSHSVSCGSARWSSSTTAGPSSDQSTNSTRPMVTSRAPSGGSRAHDPEKPDTSPALARVGV